MKRIEAGVWEAIVQGNLHLRAYKYRFVSYGKERETVDIYSRAVTKTVRSVVVDPIKPLLKAGPKKSPDVEQTEDAIIYEIHIGDMTSDPNTNVENKGKYLGLTETGRTGTDGVTVGIDHIVELGVTHVHIMPFNDIHYVNEGEEGEYGWAMTLICTWFRRTLQY